MAVARVLLVEPNDHLRRLFRRRFAREGFELIEASDGEAALGAARGGHLDLIVVEESVRDAAGRELPLRLAADPELREVPLIVLGVRAAPVEGAVERLAKRSAAIVPDGNAAVAAPPASAAGADGGARGPLQELRHPFRPGRLVELARGVLELEGAAGDGRGWSQEAGDRCA